MIDSVKNREIAGILYQMAELLELHAENRFKIIAYSRAARAIESLTEDIEQVCRDGRLEGIPGVGKAIAEKIKEYLRTGRIQSHQDLLADTPQGLAELLQISGLGPKTVFMLHEKLDITNLDELEKAAREHRIRRLPRMGVVREKNILKSIERYRKRSNRILYSTAESIVDEILTYLGGIEGLEHATAAGSYRRRKETVGDIDILATAARPEEIVAAFVKMPLVEEVLAKGPTKASVIMNDTIQVDLRIVEHRSYGTVLQYFTGSKEHNIALRRLAIQKGFKLSEYGLFENDKMAAGKTEEEIYQKLGLDWIAPEMRENAGEIEAAQNGKLPRLLEYGSLKGDLHCHSNWSDGKNSIEELAAAAMAMGYEYLGIADHTHALKVAGGLDEDQLRQRNAEIDALNQKIRSQGKMFAVLKGCEANIDDDGGIDLDKGILGELDFVIAGVHMNFKMDAKKMTRRLVGAAENPDIDIISHPTGRLLKERPAYELEIEKMFEVAKEHGAILEINAQPRRLDLKPLHVRGAIANGIKLAINTDAHRLAELEFARFGIAQARRGWATAAIRQHLAVAGIEKS